VVHGGKRVRNCCQGFAAGIAFGWVFHPFEECVGQILGQSHGFETADCIGGGCGHVITLVGKEWGKIPFQIMLFGLVANSSNGA
jgi:hypothetical protein